MYMWQLKHVHDCKRKDSKCTCGSSNMYMTVSERLPGEIIILTTFDMINRLSGRGGGSAISVYKANLS